MINVEVAASAGRGHPGWVLDVPGLKLLEEWISPSDEAEIIAQVDARPWDTSLRRRVQQYGVAYAYRSHGVVKTAAPRPPLPAWLASLGDLLVRGCVFDRAPEQVIVNEYQPGQGIASHVDHPAFGPTIASLSLGSAAIIEFIEGAHVTAVALPRRSLLVLTGPARTTYRHRIPPRKSDVCEGIRVARARRISLTFRTVG